MPALDLNFSDSQSIGSDQEEFSPTPKKKKKLDISSEKQRIL